MAQKSKVVGMAIAASAAALFMAGCAATGGSGSGTAASIHCEGANQCKGMSDCKTATSECAGMNDCKGIGFVALTPVQCKKVTGFDRPA